MAEFHAEELPIDGSKGDSTPNEPTPPVSPRSPVPYSPQVADEGHETPQPGIQTPSEIQVTSPGSHEVPQSPTAVPTRFKALDTSRTTPISTGPPTPASDRRPPSSRNSSHTQFPAVERPRTDSQSTSQTTTTLRSVANGSVDIVVSALESIAASKDARKRKSLADAITQALAVVKAAPSLAQTDPSLVFRALHLATESTTTAVVTTALDCIAKLINYSYFQRPEDARSPSPSAPPLIEEVIDAVCDCSRDDIPAPEIQMNMVKALLAAILNDKIVVHGAGLLKCLQQTHNLFLQSRTLATQQVAQSVLMQMIGTVFERVKARLALRDARAHSAKSSAVNGADDSISEYATANEGATPDHNYETPTGGADSAALGPADNPDLDTGAQPMTLQTFETRRSLDENRISDNAPTIITPMRPSALSSSRTPSGQNVPSITVQTRLGHEELEDEAYVKDAFLIFRSMCKLSGKPMVLDDSVDQRSQKMRSKLLTLNIIQDMISQHHAVFTSPFATVRVSSGNEQTKFTQAIKQYLCLSLTRNGASSVESVFAVSCSIFWLMLKHLRVYLKRELEVFMKEIYLAILEKRSAPPFQKHHIATLFGKIASDGKVLVELYLNYDCDRAVSDNMFQRIIEHVSRQACAAVTVTPDQEDAYYERAGKHRAFIVETPGRATTHGSTGATAPPEYAAKQQSLECLVESLRSMVAWSQQALADASNLVNPEQRTSIDDQSDRAEGKHNDISSGSRAPSGSDTMSNNELSGDDPAELERVKQEKTAINEAMRQFNFKPKRGLKMLIDNGFISPATPEAIAAFLLGHERINKTSLGEFLGEPAPENIAIMHAFVDQLDFAKTRFVEALRRFLQSFRLPGEAQKIDRLMLKFAERYTNGNPQAFANADTAYVLSYSVIMLNTDQHSNSVKKRMTVEDFIKNNRGINDNENLPDEYLRGIFDEIANHEIVLHTERETAANLGLLAPPSVGLAANIGQAIATVGRDLQREAYAQASEVMANKTEQMFKSLMRSQRKSQHKGSEPRYIEAQSSLHVGPMFEATWTSYLTALSGHAQETSNLNAISLCIEGQKLAIRIACLFDLENPRRAFLGSLSRSTNLYNLSELKARNVEALKALVEIALSQGNLLKESWRDVLTCISQLDRFQLISTGVKEGDIPDVIKGQPQTRPLPGANKRRQRPELLYNAGIAEELGSADMIRGVDRIFTNTASLTGEAIVHFVEALTQVSWQEVQSSGSSDQPRTYSLQKLVEVSGYNMTRVRFEWTAIWQKLGEHFVQVGCHHNTVVVYFALNSLRQLSMRFMEIEELPGFKFQKDFLKPFEHILTNAKFVPVKDMVLRCLIQMIQARGQNIRSGWRTMFGVFTAAAKEPHESIVNLAFDNVTQVYNERFGVVVSQGAFADLMFCLTEFSKNQRFQKKSLQAIEILRSSITKMLRTPECPLSRRVTTPKDPSQALGLPKQPSTQTEEEQFWFPVLFAFHDVLMTGEDLEVRSRALDYLFETLRQYGDDFPQSFWDTLWRQLLYPIFMVLKSKSDMSRALNNEELSVWLSTTMIEALRRMIRLYTHFFDALEYMLDRFLQLLELCICQENDTLARIGSNCLQQLTLNNVKKFKPHHWEQIIQAFEELFRRTEATALFSAANTHEFRSPSMSSMDPTPKEMMAAIENGQLPGVEKERDPSPVSEHHLQLTTSHSSSNRATPDTEVADPMSVHGTASPTSHHVNGSASSSRTDLESFNPQASGPQQPVTPVVVTATRRKFFNRIITKCVLQLLMIETVSELFTNDAVYSEIPSHLLLRLMSLLKKSYKFARRFNEDRDLRTRLFREGFMRQPPNLLKQESGSASVYINILLRMYADDGAERRASRAETEHALVPLCADILTTYIELDDETQQRNIMTWRPVVVDVLEGYTSFGPEEFQRHVGVFGPLAVGLMNRPMGAEMQRAVQGLWARVCEISFGVKPRLDLGRSLTSGGGGSQPLSPVRSTVFGSRRSSTINKS